MSRKGLINLYFSRSLMFGKNSCVCRHVLAVSHLVWHFWRRCGSNIFLATILPSGSSYISASRHCSSRRVGQFLFILCKWIHRSRQRSMSMSPATTGRHAADVVAYVLVSLIRTSFGTARSFSFVFEGAPLPSHKLLTQRLASTMICSPRSVQGDSPVLVIDFSPYFLHVHVNLKV